MISITNLLRWVARIASSGLLLFFVYMALLEGLPSIGSLSTHETIAMVLVVSMLLGIIIAFKFELFGGALALLAYMTFAWFEKELLVGPIFPVFGIIGLVYVGIGLQRK